MPSTPAARAVLRQSRFLLRHSNFRSASTTAETAAKAKDAASDVASKASEGLTRVQSSAASSVSRAAANAQNALSRVGGRTGRAIRFVESLIPPTIYYARVGMELSKLVFQGRKMTPPSVSQFSSYFQPLANAVRNPRTIMSSAGPAASPGSFLSSIRNGNMQQLIAFGVVGAEILGFFTVGTMVGRMKIVGYHGEPHHAH